MGKTSIEWTDKTWNPVRGCSRVSEGCTRCYAERMAARNLPEMRSPTTGQPFAVRTAAGPRWTGAVELIPSKLDEPLRWRSPRRVFVNSMSDLFHESLPFTDVAKVFERMAWGFRLACRKVNCACECEHDPECYGGEDGCRCWREVANHTYQILTKRPRRMIEFFAWLDEPAQSDRSNGETYAPTLTFVRHEADWPMENVWLGVSVEDQATADERIPLLLQTPAAVHWVSYEPALERVDFRAVPYIPGDDSDSLGAVLTNQAGVRIDWIVVGGESGPRARPCDVAWARSTVAQCRAAGVPVFVKQMGGNVRTRNDSLATDDPPVDPRDWPEPEEGWDDGAHGNLEHIDDGYQGAPVRIRTKDRKGGDMQEWPSDLRIREFPA